MITPGDTLDHIWCMDALTFLRLLPDESVHCIVSSPPYWNQRDYQIEGQIGMEETPQAFVAILAEIFHEAKRVLRSDGTCWINLGDSYANDTKHGGATGGKHAKALHGNTGIGRHRHKTGMPSKSLIGIPWRVAFALQNDGWILRMDNIWHKPDAMPEPVKDRPTKDHEYIFFFTKSPHYYYNQDSIRERQTGNTHPRGSGSGPKAAAADRHLVRNNSTYNQSMTRYTVVPGGRNARSVWSIHTEKSKSDHYATYPKAIPLRCILAGCPEGGIVLDMFMGTGTTAVVASRYNRRFIGCDLNPKDVQRSLTRVARSNGQSYQVAPGVLQQSLLPPQEASDHLFN